ncbi:dethiobiotin synthase [Flavihumibacter profundi]|jgi:dethiobiotin synthetase|uniref:dethiobiotin synthase n=1 Tax=Flavihumibacter profundi TaxID=2716883 RepID=UPI001CC51801|nr:dethiobiotin synthase [Flavihumibacter profundi]MBZ5855956.1 dethiobiotin synthase [Flavihumibacter profundi]
MPAPIFITGIGTGIGKTLVAAIVTEALQADYWKPVQAGFAEGTDSEWVKEKISNKYTIVHPELYRLKLPASPHIAAREEGIEINVSHIAAAIPSASRQLVIEGAGGLMVPLNKQEFVADLIREMGAKVVLVSRNYLGSINHSLLTAAVCNSMGLNVAGWVFNDNYGSYQEEIAHWTNLPVLGSIPFSASCDRTFVEQQAMLLGPNLKKWI